MLGPMGGELEMVRAMALSVLKGEQPVIALQGPLVQALRAEGKGKEAYALEAEVFAASDDPGEGRVWMAVTIEEAQQVQAHRDAHGATGTIGTQPQEGPEKALAAGAALIVDTGSTVSVDENPSE